MIIYLLYFMIKNFINVKFFKRTIFFNSCIDMPSKTSPYFNFLNFNKTCFLKENKFYFAEASSKKWLERQKNDHYVKRTKMVKFYN
jgi:hypothetical protein